MWLRLLAHSAKVEILADCALVSDAFDGPKIAAVTSHSLMNYVTLRKLLLLLMCLDLSGLSHCLDLSDKSILHGFKLLVHMCLQHTEPSSFLRLFAHLFVQFLHSLRQSLVLSL